MIIRKIMIACIMVIFAVTVRGQVDNGVQIPTIDGDWWQVASNPDLGKYTSPKQEPVDFGIWQAADGTWQIWSCIRKTNCGGNTRLFHRWEGESLFDTDWKPMGIAMEADTTLGERKGQLQAPHVIKKDDIFYMLYGDGENICLATSKDGKDFKRVINDKGTAALFTGPYWNTRDAMTLKHGDLYYCYYSGHMTGKEPDAAMFCRTSVDLYNWSEPMMISGGGSPRDKDSWFGGDAECPFVVLKDGLFYLFRNQMYGENNLNTQYCSPNLMDFGVNSDKYMISEMAVAAPEIVFYKGEHYMAALLPSLDGIRIAKLKWVKK